MQFTQKSVKIAGWTVKDVAGHTYKLTGALKAGKTLTVHTGRGTANKPAGHRYWGSKSYIWNNTGDTATLRTNKGAFVHKCTWGSSGSATTCAPKPAPTKSTKKPTTAPTPTRAPSPSVSRLPTTATPTASPSVSIDIPIG